MVIMMVRWEAGPSKKWPKMHKGEQENNSRNPRHLVGHTGIVAAKRKFNLFFLGVKRRREIKLKMMMW
jgi:hypothetical protein